MNAPILSKNTLENIQGLIEINLDSSKGFEEASKRCDDPSLGPVFRALGTERAAFAGELQRLVSQNGELPETSGSLLGTAHRWWMKLRDSVDSDDTSLLSEMERGEDSIKKCYEKVIADVGTSAIATTLHSQHGQILRGHDRIRDLRDRAKASSRS